jgi:hypothetical protein
MFIEKDLKHLLLESEAKVMHQEAYIRELETLVDDLQKALDTVLLNKCRVRKVKVKVYGRSSVDKILHRYVRQAED